jgi:gamma-glutamyltranspeptidase/glutathione hydrolase/leukotriene-C4 hydrolase
MYPSIKFTYIDENSFEFNFLFFNRTNISRRRVFIALFIAIIIVVGIVTIYSFSIKNDTPEHAKSKLLRGAVAANGKECAAMGAEILKMNGSVADAAVTTMLCEGITCESFLLILSRINH